MRCGFLCFKRYLRYTPWWSATACLGFELQSYTFVNTKSKLYFLRVCCFISCFNLNVNDISTANIFKMKVYQFQRDGDEQARCGFKSLPWMHTSCGRRKLLTAIQFLTTLHTSHGRRSLLTATQLSGSSTHQMSAGVCLHPYGFPPYCTHRRGAGVCLKPYSFLQYCIHRVGAVGCLKKQIWIYLRCWISLVAVDAGSTSHVGIHIYPMLWR